MGEKTAIGGYTKLKDGSYKVRVRFTKPDGQKSSKEARVKTEAEAKRKLKELQRKVDEIIELQIMNVDGMSTAEYFEKFLKYKKANLKSTSYNRLTQTVRTHIIPECGLIPFTQLDNNDIQNILDNMYSQNLSHSSIKKVYDAFGGCYKYATQIARDINPLKNPMPAVNMIAQGKFEKKEIVFLNQDEIKRFTTEALRKYKTGAYVHKYGPAFVFMLNTGIRSGEMRALCEDDIDCAHKTAEISRTVIQYYKDGKYIIELQNTPKTNSSHRIIPLNDTAFDCLNIIKAQAEPNSTTLISTQRGNLVKDYNLIKQLKIVLREADISFDDNKITGLHLLRHTYASMLFENEVDIKTISELLGHRTTAITENTYIHLTRKRKAQAVEAIELT